ncbi:unnamed protein product, partial [Mesorhabditis belari]|uniref:GAR domain-containing protein n=1 Tax=Mesorhabditis belari TaxID=2138241 RepID=A0AAF3EJK5_9BILA
MVRILRSTVMVRVGGGWVTLEEFLRSHDPCRAIALDNNFVDKQTFSFKGDFARPTLWMSTDLRCGWRLM